MQTKHLIPLAAIFLVAGWGDCLPAAWANPQADCDCGQLVLPASPGNSIGFTVTWAYPPAASQSFLTVTMLGGGTVPAGVYQSWCADAQTALLPGIEGYLYTARIYSTADTNLNHFLAMKSSNTNVLVGPAVWQDVNYILNHRTGFNYWDVQGAIWHFVGGPAVATPPYPAFNQAAVSQLINNAISNAAAWRPQTGDSVAALAAIDWAVDNQTVIIELPCPGMPPGLAVTVNWPTDCGLVGFDGSVTNEASVTLTNVNVFSSQTGDAPLLGPISLAPGASAVFSGNYVVPCLTNRSTNTVSILMTNTVTMVTSNSVAVITTNTAGSVTTNFLTLITTNDTRTVTTNLVAPTFGTIDPATGALTDRFIVPVGLQGLMFADQDENWGPDLFYAIREPGSGADTFDTISTIGSLAGTVTDRFNLSSTNYDALTLAAPDVGYGAVNFYSTRHDTGGSSTFGVIKAAGASSSSDLWAIPGATYDGLTFAAADLGYGANLFYFIRQDATGLSTFGTINPTPGGIVTDRYAVGTNFDSLVFVPGAVSTWGTGIFTYLRHDATGSIIGTIDPVTHVVTDRVDLGTNLLSALTYTGTDVGYGPDLFYYLRPGGAVLTTNLGTNFSTNIVATITTNDTVTYSTNNRISFSTNTVTTLTTNTVTTVTTNTVAGASTNTITAIATDACQGDKIAAIAAWAGVSPLPGMLVIGKGGIPPAGYSDGNFNLTFATQTGETYLVQFKGAWSDPTWTTLQTVTGTGGTVVISHSSAAQAAGFYRLVITP